MVVVEAVVRGRMYEYVTVTLLSLLIHHFLSVFPFLILLFSLLIS